MASTDLGEFSRTTDATVRRVERVRFGAGRIDYVLLLTVATLLFIGLMMVTVPPLTGPTPRRGAL